MGSFLMNLTLVAAKRLCDASLAVAFEGHDCKAPTWGSS